MQVTTSPVSAAALSAMLLIGAVGCDGGSSASDGPKTTKLAAARSACVHTVNSAIKEGGMSSATDADGFMTLGDAGKTLTVQSSIDVDSGMGLPVAGTALHCVLQKSGAPKSVEKDLLDSDAASGEAKWGHIKMAWTFDEDEGVGALLRES